MQQNYFNKQLVLIGGGHANIQVLKKLCMNEYIGLHTILISDSYNSIYSGMTPGFIQGKFSLDEISIDLQRLCFNAGSIFIKDTVIKLDRRNKLVYLKNHSPISYDILSINSGSISNNKKIKFKNNKNIIPVKPISQLVQKIKYIDKKIKSSKYKNINIIGGGVAAYEIGLSLSNRYQGQIAISIISRWHLAEKNLNNHFREKLKNLAKNMSFKIISSNVKEIFGKKIILENDEILFADIILISSGAMIPKWLEKSNLELLDEFLGTNNHLQSLNDENIFITGDAATIQGNLRSKSGVMAVRQGEILKDNIFLKLRAKPLKVFKAQKNWLYIIGINRNSALINYYSFSLHGRIFWNLKEFIDKNFLKKFFFPNKVSMKKKSYFLDHSIKLKDKMFCQGCGSKVSKNTLLKYLNSSNSNKELTDSTILEIKQSRILQTIDHIKLFQSFDPSDFGIISYLHSQNDILASGGSVKSLSVSVGIPFSENYVENFYLEYFMRGIMHESEKEDSVIAAGHSYQTHEPGITITMNGIANQKLKKSFAKKNDLIYLSKPLGTGYLLAAYYKNSPLIKISDFEKLSKFLKKGNKISAKVALSNNCRVMTDISGFGLASHLGDICKNSNVSAKISIKEEILINKNKILIDEFESTGFKNNYLATFDSIDINTKHPFYKILFDPQTNGPLLMAINPSEKEFFENEFSKLNNFNPILIGKFIEKKAKLISVN